MNVPWQDRRAAQGTEGSPTAALLVDASDELRIVWCNQLYLDMLPIPRVPADVVGRKLAEVSPVAAAGRQRTWLAVAETGEAAHGEDYMTNAATGGITVKWSVYPLPDRRLLGLFSVYTGTREGRLP